MLNKPYAIDLYQGDDVFGTEDEGFALAKASGIVFLDHKASQGITEVDKRCAFRREKWMDGQPVTVTDVDGTILKLLPKFGFYHFNGGADAGVEARHFITSTKDAGFQPGDDLCLDWERIGASGKSMTAVWADNFCRTVEDWCGFPIKEYGGDVPREQLINVPTTILERHAARRFWFCQYGLFNPILVPLPWQKAGPDYWQDDGDQYGPGPHTIPGIARYCDNSTVVGTMTVAKLYARWGGNMAPIPATV